MQGRNAPCPCGSSKKYKKCCALNNEGSDEQLVNEELQRIIMNYGDKLLDQTIQHMSALERLDDEWQRKLKDLLSHDEIGVLMVEYYLYFLQREQWSRYILKLMNGTVRSKTRAILANWQHPVLFIGKIIGEDGNYFEAEELLGHDSYRFLKEDFTYVNKDDILIGFILKDTRIVENGAYSLSEIIGVQDLDGALARQIQELAEASETKNQAAFFEKHMLDIYQLILAPNEELYEDLHFTHSQQMVLEILEDKLSVSGEEEDQVEVAKMLAIGYLIGENPSFRKPETIAAAVFKAMDNYGMLEMYGPYSQKEVARMFEVSVSAMTKHIEPIEEILELMIGETLSENMLDGDPMKAYRIGTDPDVTERINWEIDCGVTDGLPDSFDDIQQLVNVVANAPFIPKGKAQEAQDYAYQAYEQEDYEGRMRLAKKAYASDPNNVDAMLLKAEGAETIEKAKQLYKRAIMLGELTYDDESANLPWEIVTNRPYLRALFAYGTFLFDQERYIEALEYFQKVLEMHQNDHQSARHLAIASAIHAEQFVLARQLMDEFDRMPNDDNIYLLLEWLLASEGTEEDLLTRMLDENDHLQAILNIGLDEIPYPKKVLVSPGSPEEALYMACLLKA